mgnify:FL=1|jgi:hypothetical protein
MSKIFRMAEGGSVMTMTDKGEILEEIGRLVDDQLGGNSENSFLYAEIAKNLGSAYILEEDEGRMIFHVADMEIFWAAMALWELEPKRRRWQAMRYSMADGKFTAEFDYPEDLDQEEFSGDRAMRVLREYAGNRAMDNTLEIEKFRRLYGYDI